MRIEFEKDKNHKLQVKQQIIEKKERKVEEREREFAELEETRRLEDLRRRKMNEIVQERLQVRILIEYYKRIFN